MVDIQVGFILLIFINFYLEIDLQNRLELYYQI